MASAQPQSGQPPYSIRGTIPKDSTVIMGQDTDPLSVHYGHGKWYGFFTYVDGDSLCFRIAGDTICVDGIAGGVNTDTRLIPYVSGDSLCFYQYNVVTDDTTTHQCFFIEGGGGVLPISDSCYFTQAMSFSVEQFDIDVVTGQELHFNVPVSFHGWVVDTVLGFHSTTGVTGESLISVYNVTQAEDVVAQFDIDAGNLVQTQTGNYVLTADDIIRIRVDGQCTTPAKGLRVVLIVRGLVPCIAYPVTTYQDGDSLCIVVNADTTCYFIAGGGGADTHFFADPLSATGSQSHNQKGYEISIDSALAWTIYRPDGERAFAFDDNEGVIQSLTAGGNHVGLHWTSGGTTRLWTGIGPTPFEIDSSAGYQFDQVSIRADYFLRFQEIMDSRITLLASEIEFHQRSDIYGTGNYQFVNKPPFDDAQDTVTTMDENGYLKRSLKGGANFVILENYDSIKAYAGASNYVFVTDSLWGGYFYQDTIGTPDSALIVDGAGSREWVRIVEDNKYWLTWWINNDTTWSDEIQRAIDTISARHGEYGDGVLYIPDTDSIYYLDTVGIDPYDLTDVKQTKYCVELKSNVSILMDEGVVLMLSDSMVTFGDSLNRVNIFIGDSIQHVSVEGGVIDGNVQGQYQESPTYYGQTWYGNIINITDTIWVDTLPHGNVHLLFKNITLRNHSGNAANIFQADYVDIQNVRVDGTGEGFQLYRSDYINLDGYYANDSTDIMEGDGFEVSRCNDITLRRMLFEADGGLNMGTAIDLSDSRRITISDVVVNDWHSGIALETGVVDEDVDDVLIENVWLNCSAYGIDAAQGSMYLNGAYIKNANDGIRLINTYVEGGITDINYIMNTVIDSCEDGIDLQDSTHAWLYNVTLDNIEIAPIRYRKAGTNNRPYVYWNVGEIKNSVLGLNIRVDQAGDASWFPVGEFYNVRMTGDPFEFQNSVSEYGNFKLIQIDTNTLWISHKLKVIGSGGLATTITGRDANKIVTSVTEGYGLDLTAGVLLVDTTQIATQFDISGFHNGIFDPFNDGSTSVPTGFNVVLTDNIEFGGNVLYMSTSNDRVGIREGSPATTFSVGDRGGAASQFGVDVNSTSGYNGSIVINDVGLYLGHNSSSRNLYFQTDLTNRFWIEGSNGAFLRGNEANDVIPQLTIENASVLNDNFILFLSDADLDYFSFGVDDSENRMAISEFNNLSLPYITFDNDDDKTRLHRTTTGTPFRPLAIDSDDAILEGTWAQFKDSLQIVGLLDNWLLAASGTGGTESITDNETVTITGAGINAATRSGSNVTITGTEVDGSTTNELQTLASTSDVTSHTVTLSNSGGSIQLVEGSGVTLTTTGTAGDGIVTIASSGTADHDIYEVGGTSPPDNIADDKFTQGTLHIGGTAAAAQTLQVTGTARITGSHGTATTITGRDADGDISNVGAGNFLTMGSGTIDWDGFIIDGPDDAETFTVGSGISTINFQGVGIDADIQVGGNVEMELDFVELPLDAAIDGDEYIAVVDTGGTDVHAKIVFREAVQDIYGAAVSGNTEAGILVTYDDADGTLDFVATDASTTNELLDVEKNNVSVQTGNLRLDFTSGFGVTLDGAGEVDIEHAFNEFSTDLVAEGDEFIIMYDVSLGDEEKIDIDDLATYIGADGNGIYGGSGTVPTTTVATLTNNITFAGTAPVVRIEDTNNSGTGSLQFEINETTQGITQPIGQIKFYVTDSGYNAGATTEMSNIEVTGLVDDDDHAQFRVELPASTGSMTPVISTVSSPDWRNTVGGSFFKNYGGAQVLMTTITANTTLDAGYYGVVCTSSAATVTLPEIAAAMSYSGSGVIVGTQFYIINRTGGDVTVQGFNDTGDTNDDFFNGAGATNTIVLPNNTSSIFTASRILSNEGDWDVTD